MCVSVSPVSLHMTNVALKILGFGSTWVEITLSSLGKDSNIALASCSLSPKMLDQFPFFFYSNSGMDGFFISLLALSVFLVSFALSERVCFSAGKEGYSLAVEP